MRGENSPEKSLSGGVDEGDVVDGGSGDPERGDVPANLEPVPLVDHVVAGALDAAASRRSSAGGGGGGDGDGEEEGEEQRWKLEACSHEKGACSFNSRIRAFLNGDFCGLFLLHVADFFLSKFAPKGMKIVWRGKKENKNKTERKKKLPQKINKGDKILNLSLSIAISYIRYSFPGQLIPRTHRLISTRPLLTLVLSIVGVNHNSIANRP